MKSVQFCSYRKPECSEVANADSHITRILEDHGCHLWSRDSVRSELHLCSSPGHTFKVARWHPAGQPPRPSRAEAEGERTSPGHHLLFIGKSKARHLASPLAKVASMVAWLWSRGCKQWSFYSPLLASATSYFSLVWHRGLIKLFTV